MKRKVLFFCPDGPLEIFALLVEELSDIVDPMFKGFELAEASQPSWDWEVKHEVEAIDQLIRDNDIQNYDLVGYSSGASVLLAYLTGDFKKPNTAVLIEPLWIGNDEWSDEEIDYRREFDEMLALSPLEIATAFKALFVQGNTGKLPDRNEKQLERDALNKRISWKGFMHTNLDRDTLKTLNIPVYLPVGTKSHPRMIQAAQFLSKLFPDVNIEFLEGQHHLNICFKGAKQMAQVIRRMWSDD
jgi:pimeloyl-ACP methyl ester carboxylesterase